MKPMISFFWEISSVQSTRNHWIWNPRCSSFRLPVQWVTVIVRGQTAELPHQFRNCPNYLALRSSSELRKPLCGNGIEMGPGTSRSVLICIPIFFLNTQPVTVALVHFTIKFMRWSEIRRLRLIMFCFKADWCANEHTPGSSSPLRCHCQCEMLRIAGNILLFPQSWTWSDNHWKTMLF